MRRLNVSGRRVQDKANLKTQLDLDHTKVVNLTWGVLASDIMATHANVIALLNNKEMREGEERMKFV